MNRSGLRVGVAAAAAGWAGVLLLWGAGVGFQLRSAAGASHALPVPNENSLQKATVEELIDRFQEESEEGIGAHSTAWASGFLPVDDEAQFQGGILGSAKPHKSSTMTELVRRGVAALPALLAHLTDARPTRLTVGDRFMGRWFMDEYAPRYVDPRKQPPGVNQFTLASRLTPDREFKEYTLKVGDLCYVAVGQIVNRGLDAVRYQPTLCLVVNSPVQTPALAEAVRKDWSGLTAKEHERALRQEALGPADPGALVRLLYYYPPTGRAVAVKLLNRPLFESSVAYHFFSEKVVPAPPETWPGLLQQFRKANGEAGYRGLQGALVSASTLSNRQIDAEREREKKAADQILARFFPGVDPLNPPFLNAAPYSDQESLVQQLASFHWPGLDEAIHRLYLRAVAAPPSDLGERLERDDLALACAERLVGKGYDGAFRAYFKQRLRQVKRELIAARRSENELPPGNAGYGPALLQRIDFYGAFLKRLSKPARGKPG